ncbi:MAG: hypothetical protein J5I65_13555 [Aridibacter famidurans]|nr:hypothetical protein [Aridibacter famidurans]
MEGLLEELKSVVAGLDEVGIEYALCGSLSLAVHGAPRATRNIDLLIAPEQVEDAIRVSAGLGFDICGSELSLGVGEIEIRRVSKVDSQGNLLSLDLILVTPQIQQVWEGKETYELPGMLLAVVSREGLISMKRLAGRPQDLADISKLGDEEN